jgi:hypothetical protein
MQALKKLFLEFVYPGTFGEEKIGRPASGRLRRLGSCGPLPGDRDKRSGGGAARL